MAPLALLAPEGRGHLWLISADLPVLHLAVLLVMG